MVFCIGQIVPGFVVPYHNKFGQRQMLFTTMAVYKVSAYKDHLVSITLIMDPHYKASNITHEKELQV